MRHASTEIEGNPGTKMPVIRFDAKRQKRDKSDLVWGLLPHNATAPTRCIRPIHARAETVREVAPFADAFRRRRALIPVTTGFVTASTGFECGNRFAFSRVDGQVMAYGGLWESYVWSADRIERSFCVITTEATGQLAQIHDRAPLIIEKADWPLWLGEVEGDVDALLRPTGETVLKCAPVKQGNAARRAAHV